MAEVLPYDDPEGEAALAREIAQLRRRRGIGWATGLGVLAAIAGVFAWPVSPCERLARHMCQRGLLHCERSRDRIKRELERDECSDLNLHDYGSAAELLIERFPDVEYTAAEQAEIAKNPRHLP